MFATCRPQNFNGPPRLAIQNNMPTMGSKRYLADALDSVNTEYSVNLKVPIDTVISLDSNKPFRLTVYLS